MNLVINHLAFNHPIIHGVAFWNPWRLYPENTPFFWKTWTVLSTEKHPLSPWNCRRAWLPLLKFIAVTWVLLHTNSKKIHVYLDTNTKVSIEHVQLHSSDWRYIFKKNANESYLSTAQVLCLLITHIFYFKSLVNWQRIMMYMSPCNMHRWTQ